MLHNRQASSSKEEIQTQWTLLTQQLAELERDRIRETRTEERFRLDQVITRVKEDRWQLEKELQELEAQPEGKSRNSMQATQEDLCPPWLREQLLRRFRNDLSCRLESFFGEHGSITLPKNFSPTDVSRAHSLREKVIEYSLEQAGSTARTIERDVVEIFNQPDINQRLAILGKPGSGKTSCLLRIFDHILEAAEQDIQNPLPVVFECSEWNGGTLPAWMAHQLVVKYDLKKERAQKLIQGELIFPFFDGLDELKGELQERFVEAFNAFQHGHPMLLCCRVTEYRQLKKKVQLNNALVLHDISAQRLEAYLRQEKLEDLWRLLQAEPTLMELAGRPLFLSIMLQLEEGKLLTGHAGMKRGEDAEQFLWRLYLNCCLRGTPSGRLCSETPSERRYRYTEKQALYWLRCLADRMTSEGMVELRIEEMQPSWLNHSRRFKTTYILIYGLIIGCSVVLAGSLAFGGMTFGLAYGLSALLTHELFIWLLGSKKWTATLVFYYAAFALALLGLLAYVLLPYRLDYALSEGLVATGPNYAIVFGLALGLLSTAMSSGIYPTGYTDLKHIEIIGKIKRPVSISFFQNLKKNIIDFTVWLVYGLMAGLIFGPALGLVAGVSLGLAIGVTFGLTFGLKKLENPVLDAAFPGQGLTYAVRSSLLLAPVFSTAAMLIFVRVNLLAYSFNIEGYFFNIPFLYYGYFMLSICCFILLGADIVLGHYILRVLLWQEGQLPFRLVIWLEDLHQRKLLQRVGGSYHFIHKRLQEYLAQMNGTGRHNVP